MLWSESSIQAESDWLFLWCSCQYCEASLYCSSQGSRIDKTVSLPVVYRAPSSTITLANKNEASRLVPAWFPHVLWLKYVTLWSISCYCQVLEGSNIMTIAMTLSSNVVNLSQCKTLLTNNCKEWSPVVRFLQLGILYITLWCLLVPLTVR